MGFLTLGLSPLPQLFWDMALLSPELSPLYTHLIPRLQPCTDRVSVLLTRSCVYTLEQKEEDTLSVVFLGFREGVHSVHVFNLPSLAKLSGQD